VYIRGAAIDLPYSLTSILSYYPVEGSSMNVCRVELSWSTGVTCPSRWPNWREGQWELNLVCLVHFRCRNAEILDKFSSQKLSVLLLHMTQALYIYIFVTVVCIWFCTPCIQWCSSRVF